MVMKFDKWMESLRVNGEPLKLSREQRHILNIMNTVAENARLMGKAPVTFKPTGRLWDSTFPGIKRG